MGTLVNGIKEIFATSQTTATHLPVCASDGTPRGRISVGDLASVLGVATTISDCNYLKAGVFNVSVSSTSNMPSDVNYGILLNYERGGNFLQLCISSETEGLMFTRRYSSANHAWSDWKRFDSDIPTFYKNYQTIADLANAISNNIVNIPTDSFASLQGKNYQSFRWINDGVSTPFDASKSTTMGRCTTSLAESQYTMIDIWHIATPSIVYRGVMTNGVVANWLQISMGAV